MSIIRETPMSGGNRTEPPPPTKMPRLALRQRVEGRAIGDTHMGGGGELQPAADHRAVQHGDDRHAAEFDAIEGAMP